jgi:hypothetical protein
MAADLRAGGYSRKRRRNSRGATPKERANARRKPSALAKPTALATLSMERT